MCIYRGILLDFDHGEPGEIIFTGFARTKKFLDSCRCWKYCFYQVYPPSVIQPDMEPADKCAVCGPAEELAAKFQKLYEAREKLPYDHEIWEELAEVVGSEMEMRKLRAWLYDYDDETYKGKVLKDALAHTYEVEGS